MTIGFREIWGSLILFKVSPHIAWHDVPGELALFDTRDGTYHALNSTGAAIWRALAAGVPEAAVVERFATAHDAPHDMIAGNVRDFIRDALDKGLLQPGKELA